MASAATLSRWCGTASGCTASTARGARRRASPCRTFAASAKCPSSAGTRSPSPARCTPGGRSGAVLARARSPRCWRLRSRYARQGFPVAPVIAAHWSEQAPRFRCFREFARVFLPGGRAPAAGEIFRNPDLAASLEELAATEGSSLYTGALAVRTADAAAAARALLSLDDLGEHQSTWVEPLSLQFAARHGSRAAAQRARPGVAGGAGDPRPPGQRAPADQQRGRGAPAGRGDEAGLRRLQAPRRRPRVDGPGSERLARPLLPRFTGAPGERAARVPTRRAPRTRARHRLPGDRRPRRAHGFLHPVELPRLRIGRGRAGDRDRAAEPRAGILARPASPQLHRGPQAPLPHHHARVRDARRKAVGGVRLHGRPHAAAGARPAAAAPLPRRPEPAGRLRCAPLVRQRGLAGRAGTGLRLRRRPGAGGARPRAGAVRADHAVRRRANHPARLAALTGAARIRARMARRLESERARSSLPGDTR